MAHEAGQTTVRALRAGCAAWAASRLAILAVAVLSAALAADEGLGATNAASFDRPALTRPLGAAGGGAWTGRLAPRYPLRRDAAWLALAPAGIGAYALALGLAHGDPLAFVSAQSLWGRELGGPLAGAWEGLRAGAEGLRTLVAGPPATATASPIGDPTRIAVLDVALLGTLVLALAATVGVLRRLPAAYGAWILAGLGLALSYPVQAQPLMSLPRFVAVLFPFFMWLALACGRRRLTAGVAVASAALLGVCVAQFAAWRFIA